MHRSRSPAIAFAVIAMIGIPRTALSSRRMAAASRFCRAHDEPRNFLRLRSGPYQHVPAARRRSLFLRKTVTVLAILEAA